METYKKEDTSPARKSNIMRKKKQPAVVMEMLKSKNQIIDAYDTASVENSKKGRR
jgi:hypothetical protein